MTHTNIEIIELNAYNGAFDVSDNAAVTNLNLIDATTANTFTVAAGQAVGVATMANGEVVDFAGNTVVTLGLTANALGTVAGAGVTIDLNSTAQTTLNVTGSTAASHIVLANTGTKLVTVNVSGDQAMKIDANTGNIALTTLNGATATGALELVIDTNTNKDIAVTGGSGDDLIVMAGTLAKGDVINGGAGNDTLSITQASMTVVNAFSAADKATMNANLSNIEALRVTDSVTASFDVERYDSINTVDLAGGVTGAITISNLASGANITVRDAPNATTDSIVVPIKNATVAGNNSDSLTVTLNDAGAGGAVDLGILNVVGLETLNIVTDSTTLAGAAGTTTAYTLDIANTSTSLNTLTVSGTKGLDLVGVALDNSIETINASALVVAATAAGLKVAIAASGTQGVVITGSAGIDTVTGGAASDIISLGGGADVYTVTTGNDVVTLGDGDDEIKITPTLFAANDATTATIDGGAGTDKITISSTSATIVDADFRGLTSFENLVTGNGTNTITLGALAKSTGIISVVGGTGTDTIDAGGAAGGFSNSLTITGGAGADLITLGAGADTVVYSGYGSSIATDGHMFDGSDTDGVVNALSEDLTESASGSAGSGDFINGFVVGTDTIKIDGALEAALEASGATIRITSAGWDFNGAGIVIVDNSVATISDFGDLSVVATAFDAITANSTNVADGDEFIVVVANTANTQHAIYYFKDADAALDLGLDVGDSIGLLGIIDLGAAGDLLATSVTI